MTFPRILAVIMLPVVPLVTHAGSDPDQRQILRLPPDERHLVLQEMRNFVTALQLISEGLANNDLTQVAQAARTMGSGAAGEIPPRVVAKLPLPFKELAGRVHTSFDTMALDAESLADVNHTLGQMSAVLQNCMTCHSMYQIVRE